MKVRQNATGMVLEMTRQETYKMTRPGTLLLALILPTTALGVDKPKLPVITHYEMKMRVDLAEARVESACRLTIKNIAAKPLQVIVLLLNPGFTVLEDTFYLNGQSHGFRQKEKGLEGYASVRVSTVRVVLPEPLAPGDTTTVQMNYYGPIKNYARMLHHLRDTVNETYTLFREELFAYPLLTSLSFEDAWSDQSPFTFDVEISVPKEYVVACCGVKTQATSNKDTVSYRFRSETPTSRMAIAIAKFDVLLDEANRLSVYALPSRGEHPQAMLDLMRATISFYTEFFGPPRHDHGYIAIDIPKDWGTQVGKAYFLQPLPNMDQAFRKHEVFRHIAHAWTAQPKPKVKVTRWFDEGFAAYFQALAIREFEGDGAYTELIEKHVDAFFNRADQNEDIAATPIAQYDTPRLARNARTKGALALYVLHQLVGEKPFQRIIKSFLAAHATKPADFDDFKRVSENVTGKDLDKFFDEWIYGTLSSEFILARMEMDEILARYR